MVVALASLRAWVLVLVGPISGFYVVTRLKRTSRSLRGWSLPRSSGRGSLSKGFEPRLCGGHPRRPLW
jgi:hypothetical protein